jgi:hypothetical protein
MGCLGSLVGFLVGFVLLSFVPALAGIDGSGSLLLPALAAAAGAVLLALRGSREDPEGALAGLGRGLFAGGTVGMLVTALLFGMGPF